MCRLLGARIGSRQRCRLGTVSPTSLERHGFCISDHVFCDVARGTTCVSYLRPCRLPNGFPTSYLVTVTVSHIYCISGIDSSWSIVFPTLFLTALTTTITCISSTCLSFQPSSRLSFRWSGSQTARHSTFNHLNRLYKLLLLFSLELNKTNRLQPLM